MKKFSEKNVDEVVEDTISLVHHIVRKHFPHFIGTDYYDDAVQEGVIGLLKAIEGFDESLGFEFSTYSYNAIKGAIYKNTKDLLTPANVPRGSLFKYKDYQKLRDEGFSMDEISDIIKVRKDVLQGIVNTYSYSSLNQTIGRDDYNNSIEIIDTLVTEEVEEEDFSSELRTCRTLLKLLPNELMAIFKGYIDGLNQVTLAKHFGISQVTIGRKLKKVSNEYLPIFKRYLNGDIGYGRLLLEIYVSNKGVNKHIKCYIDYALELASRGHSVKSELLDQLRDMDLNRFKRDLASGREFLFEVVELMNVIDKYCMTEFIEGLVDDMVGIYEIGRLDLLVEDRLNDLSLVAI